MSGMGDERGTRGVPTRQVRYSMNVMGVADEISKTDYTLPIRNIHHVRFEAVIFSEVCFSLELMERRLRGRSGSSITSGTIDYLLWNGYPGGIVYN